MKVYSCDKCEKYNSELKKKIDNYLDPFGKYSGTINRFLYDILSKKTFWEWEEARKHFIKEHGEPNPQPMDVAIY